MIDIDDVLSDFNKKFLEIANENFKTPLNIEIVHWNFHKSIPGFTKKMEGYVFDIIRNTEDFYESLQPYSKKEEFDLLSKLIENNEHSFYFITSRFETKGKSVEEQSQIWIKKYLKKDVNVFVSVNKGELCKELNIEIAIDDSPQHIIDLIDNGINTYIMDWAYNRHIDHSKRVSSLGNFLSIISNGR